MTKADLLSRTLKRLGEDPTSPVYFTAAEALAALNEGQRLFAFVTLCLESNVSFTPTQAFTKMLLTYPDWIAPVRAARTAGGKVRPATLAQLQALDSDWLQNSAAPSHYGCLGFDLVFVRGRGAMTVTYARMPADLVNDSDTPEIIDAYHDTLIDYAVPRCKLKQGGQELARAVPQAKRYWDAMKAAALDTLKRAQAADNDRLPFELSHFDPKVLFALKLPKGGA